MRQFVQSLGGRLWHALSSFRWRAGRLPRRRCAALLTTRTWPASLMLATLVLIAACSSSPASSTPTSTARVTPLPTIVVPAAATDLEDTIQAVIQRAGPSIVEVQSTGSQGQAIGSGDIIATDGYIVTNDHVRSCRA